MLNLQSILGDRLQKKGLARSMEAGVVCDKFDAWAAKKFGAELAGKVGAVSFVNGTLTIQASSSVISQEIKLKEDEVKQEVNGILGEQVIKSIAFRN